MNLSIRFALTGLFVIGLLLNGAGTGAQTATTGIVLGTVTDPAGGIVVDAKVELTNAATNETRSTATNSAGQYVFPNVVPGEYSVRVTKEGFRTSSSNLHVDVTKSYTLEFKLELGSMGQQVVVEAAAQVELQTADAQVGNEVNSDEMTKLPTLRRNAAALLTLQPGVTPGTGTFPRVGMRVAGAVDDQNTFTLDGIDVTDNVIGGLDANISVIPLGVEAVEEFRVGVNNPNASFGRASGGQIAVVGKNGTNNFHGSTYWYHENDDLNANEWELNRTHLPRPVIRDNRFGAAVGGPIWRDKTFFFFNYEGRRFPQQTSFTRLMPSDMLRAGTLQFTDCSSGQFDAKGNCTGGGTLRSYPLATSTLCGSGGTTACDPRGLGISPSVAALWALDPAGTDSSVANADGNNTSGFHGTASAPLSNNFYTLRFDQQIRPKWRFNGSYTYFQTTQVSGGQNAQYDIRGGIVKAVSKSPTDRDAIIAGLTGEVTPHLFNAFHFGWVRARQSFNRLAPSAAAALENIVGTSSSAGAIALAPGQAQTNLVDAPIEVDTQRARFQSIVGRNIQYVDDLSWIKSAHTLQAGINIRHIPTLHIRNDKVVGSLASLEALADADVSTFLTSIPSSERPPTCAPTVTTNCLQTGDVQRWDRLYATTLGLVDNIGILTTRDGQLNPLPFGTPLINDTTLNAFEFYGQDVWRITPNLTLTYGLSYGWQTAPKEKLNRQTLVVDTTNNNQPFTGPGYIAAKEAAALQGQTFNPTLGFEPVKSAGRNVFNIDYGDVAPRASVAWTPSFNSGLLHQLVGNRKTVVRGGYGIVYDRTNTVQSVIIPMLGVGFAQTITVGAPLCNISGTGGTGCNAPANLTDASSDPGSFSFRVGTDGNLPVPTVPAVSIPVVPSGAPGTKPFGELFSFQDDPNTKIGRSQAFDLTIQREIPWNMIMEVGWTGRWSDRLPQGVNFNSAPYFFVDPASKQTFAQAYDAVAAALASGQAPTPQPFFENQLAGLIGSACAGASTATTATQFLANAAASTFTGGLVSSLFSVMDGRRACLGMPTFQNRQLFDLHMRTYIGKSNYNGLIATLRKRTSHGLTFAATYTFSRTLDQNISNQNQAGIYSNSYFPNVDYGPSIFDRTHIFNFTYVYEFPVGKGHRFGGGSWSSRLLGGWYTSGIFSTFSGLPLFVTESSQVWGGGSIFGFNVGMIPTVDPSTFGNSTHDGICAGPGNPGSAGDGTNCASLYQPGTPLGGSSVNLFKNPGAVFDDFRNVHISTDGRTGRSRPLRGLPFWNLDSSLGKRTALTERVSFSITADFFNILNHVNFVDPTLSLTSRSSFGVISTQLVPTNRDNTLADGSRWIQLGLRIDF